MTTFDPVPAAQFIAKAHADRLDYENLPADLAPGNVDEAYLIQDALRQIWEPDKGAVAGAKIATTTKVMQELMGIDHPCGGMIYTNTILPSPATLKIAAHMHPVIECELAVRLDRDLPDKGEPYSRVAVREAVGSVAAAFEIIEDRNAVYRETDALTLIADNAWNAGIVLGEETSVAPDFDLDGIAGAIMKNGQPTAGGRTDDPMGALAWVANLAVKRGQPLTSGMVVITGSVVPTFAIETGDEIEFSLAEVGKVMVKGA